MQVMRRFRTAAVAAAMTGSVFVMPQAEAGLLTDAAGLGFEDVIAVQDTAVPGQRLVPAPVPPGIAALGLDVAQAPSCNDCGAGRTTATAPGANGTTLPVNVAILVLGSLWLTLMARRIQQRTAATRRDDAGLEEALRRALTGGAPQPAAGGR